jgi:D-serine deaminase-like pyridoxal phosphate-dependent protein
MHVEDLETPALLIDLDIMERNLKRVAGYAAQHNLRLRPHTKTHKTPALGRRQIDLGATGLTIAKVGEAEVMLGAQPQDLLLAYPLFGRRKLERLMEVARQTRVTVSLDNTLCASLLSEAASEGEVNVGVLAETDVGMGRVGVDPGEPLVDFVKTISRLPGLIWEGVAFYPGHLRSNDDAGLRAMDELSSIVDSIRSDLRHEGFEPQVISGGSTPTLFQSHLVRGMNEIRPGTYIFNDKNTVLSGACAWEDCAASVLATVVSTSRPGQMIIDGGSKTFSSDRLSGSEEVSFGRLMEDPGAVFRKMNEEHGYVDIRECSREFTVGDRVRMIPNHVCVVVNLHETMYGIRGERVEEVWKVEGRGKLQ